MANQYSTPDLLRMALSKAGEQTDGTSPYHLRALGYMNTAYIDILSGSSIFLQDLGDVFPWARSRTPLSLTLIPPYETGSVAINNGATSGTFSNAPSASLGSFQDRIIKFADNPDYYQISDHTAGSTSFTISHAYAGDTLTAGTFKAIKLAYMLTPPDGGKILRLADAAHMQRAGGFLGDSDGKIFMVEDSTMNEEFPLSRLQGRVPEHFSVPYQDEDGWLIRFSSYVIEPMKVDFPWIPQPAELVESRGSIPVIPRDKRVGLAWATAWFILDDKKDPGADKYFQLTLNTFGAMQESKRRQQVQASRNHGKLIPRRDQTSRRYFVGGE